MVAAPDGSISRRGSPRPDLLVFEVKGRITRPDIDWMASITDSVMQAHREIDMLLIMSAFEGLDFGAAFDAYAAGVMARSIGHIRRYVVVGAPTFVDVMIKAPTSVQPKCPEVEVSVIRHPIHRRSASASASAGGGKPAAHGARSARDVSPLRRRR